jgi:predicted pyridoxine 5'-phosphate oxidase superfamily flavin-nucleotide-binding protein
VLSDTTLALPERAGNRRGDGYANLLENGHAGLLFLIPGGRTRCASTAAPRSCVTRRSSNGWPSNGQRPVLAVVLEVEEVFYHCVKAFHRSGLWRPETWDRDAAPVARVGRSGARARGGVEPPADEGCLAL